MQWPIHGQNSYDWAVGNYVDQDPTSGVRDYVGGTRTYNGHTGDDIGECGWRCMDAGVPIYAAASGTVIGVADGWYDRDNGTQDCSKDPGGNGVTIQHTGGWVTIYAHMKNGSILVSSGQYVTAGTQLGLVGSSGCSSGPHLHFEMHDPHGNVVEPVTTAKWNPDYPAPPYNARVAIMDGMVTSGTVSWSDAVPANSTSISPGAKIGLGFVTGNGESGDVIQVNFTKPNGSTYNAVTLNMPADRMGGLGGSSIWDYYTYIGTDTGTWKITMLANGDVEKSYSIVVGSGAPSPPPIGAPPTPTGLTVTGTTNNSVSIAWNAVSGATGYCIYVSGTNNTGYKYAWTNTSFTQTGLTPGVTYTYQVTADDSSGESARSGPVSATAQ